MFFGKEEMTKLTINNEQLVVQLKMNRLFTIQQPLRGKGNI
jgi:hypothetical protein